jgi:RNA polymerase sigma factor (sigma-70 family)
LTDDELIEGCKRQDVHYQKLLYERFANQMMGVCLRYCNSRMEAEDVLQDSFVKIFDKINSYKNMNSLSGWVKTVVINTALRSQDKRINKFEPKSVDDIHEPPQVNHIISSMDAKIILELIQKLPDSYRVVFNLFAIEGFTHLEIAEKLNIKENTARSQYFRARKILTDLLQKYGIVQ